MRVLLVYMNLVHFPKDISLGLSSVAAVLKKAGHEVLLIDTSFGLDEEEIRTTLDRFKPGLTGICVTTGSLEQAGHVASLIKERSDAPILAGGIAATLAPEETIGLESIDIVCVGEGELPALELVESLEAGDEREDIENLWFKSDGEVVRNPVRPLIKDLDSLPPPDRGIYRYETYLKWHNHRACLVAGRGCPYQCTYCANHSLQKLYRGKGRYVRFRSVDTILDEIKALEERYRIQSIEFYDDIFTMNKKWLREFCEKYPNISTIPYYINGKVETIDDEVCRLLKGSGCKRVSIGLESGDEAIRKNVLKRSMSDEAIIGAAGAIKRAGLELYTYNIIGIPFETRASIQKTIDLNRAIKPDYIQTSIFNAYKGTDLYELCREKGWLREDTAEGSYFRNSNVDHPNFTMDELIRLRNSLGFHIFKDTRPLRAVADVVDRNLSRWKGYLRLRSAIIATLLKVRELKALPRAWAKER